MFIGKHDRSLDDKGRLVLPTNFRRDFEGGAVLAPWDRCVALWTRPSFEEVLAQLLTKAREGEAEQDLVRLFQADAWEISLDGQGRILLPDSHRRFAGIDREVTVIGQSTHIELWNAARYAAMVREKSPAEIWGKFHELKVF